MHVVIVDNSKALLDFLGKSVAVQCEKVRTFSDGQDALNYLQANPSVDILLTSLELKNLSGMELIWDMRGDSDKFKSTYCMVMSSSPDIHKLIEALDCGADDFLKKPFLVEELFARLRTAERILAAHRKLVKLATIDPLTELKNRLSFFENAEKVLASARTQDLISVIMLDIDHFKSVNDTYGHAVGDEVLRKFAQEIGSDCSTLARLGGEEFATIVVGSTLTEVFDLAENMRHRIEKMSIDIGHQKISVTCSIGISERKGDEDIDQILNSADLALYSAKESGRNKTIIFSQVHEEKRLCHM